LLAEEVTGNDALLRFAALMVRNPPSAVERVQDNSGPFELYDDQLEKKMDMGGEAEEKSESDSIQWSPAKGDVVRITGLEKSGQYNGLEGTVVSDLDSETNRCGIRIDHEGKAKTLALQVKNIKLLHKVKRAKSNEEPTTSSMEQPMSKAKQLPDDPEIIALIDSNPKFRDAVEDVLNNPMNFMKYLSDPEMSPLISKAMSKLKF